MLVIGRNEHCHSLFQKKGFRSSGALEFSFQHRDKFITVMHMAAESKIFVRLGIYIMFFYRAFGFKKHILL